MTVSETLKTELASAPHEVLPMFEARIMFLKGAVNGHSRDCLCNQELLNGLMHIVKRISSLTLMLQDSNDYEISFVDYMFFSDCAKNLSSIEGLVSMIHNSDEPKRPTFSQDRITEYDNFVRRLTSQSGTRREIPLFSETCNFITAYYDQRQKVISQAKDVIEYMCECLKQPIAGVGVGHLSKKNLIGMIEDAARLYFKNNMTRETKRLQKQARSLTNPWQADLTRSHWCMMKTTEEKAMNLAANGNLCNVKDDESLNGYKTDEKIEMDKYASMIETVADKFSDDQLFDLGCMVKNSRQYSDTLNYDNIDLFFRMVLRGNIIRCNLYPELKPEFEAWMKGEKAEEAKEQKTNTTGCELSETDESAMREIVGILARNGWKKPASNARISEWIEVLYGAKPAKLDKCDSANSEEFRKFFRTGRGSKLFTRLQVSTANVIGYLMECGYRDSEPKKLSRDFFDKEGNENNINHGKKDNRSAAFENLIPFMDKYRLRIIEKQG